MNNTESSPGDVSAANEALAAVIPETTDKDSIFVSFAYKGKDNGTPKEGIDSRVLAVPVGTKFSNAKDLQELTNALAGAYFDEGHRYENLELTLLYVLRLPV